MDLFKIPLLQRLTESMEWLGAREKVLSDAADAHRTEALTHVAGDYMGEHWLASFALLALMAGEPIG